MTADPAGTGLRVTGGPAGTAARLAELAACADLLVGTGRTVGARAGLVVAVQTGPLAATLPAAPGTGAAAELALARCLAGPHGLLVEAARLVALGEAQRAAVSLYLGADAAAGALLRGAAAGLLGPPALLADPVLLAGLTGAGLHLLRPPAGPVRLAGVPPPGGLRPGSRPGGDGGWRPGRPAGGAAGLAAAIGASPSGRPPAAGAEPQVRVQRVTAGGAVHWVVTVSGTRSWSPRRGTEPFDLSSDLDLLGGPARPGAPPADATAGVLAAMSAAGIRPGQPVLLAGHSQGGMVAAAVAADPVLRRRFTVTHVVAFGAPVSRVPVPDDVRVLVVEHSDDPVPLADGAAEPDRPGRLLVRARSPAGAPPGALPLGLPFALPFAPAAHDLAGYAVTAAALDRASGGPAGAAGAAGAAPDPSLQAWRRSAAAFLDPGPDAVVAERWFTARRPAFG